MLSFSPHMVFVLILLAVLYQSPKVHFVNSSEESKEFMSGSAQVEHSLYYSGRSFLCHLCIFLALIMNYSEIVLY